MTSTLSRPATALEAAPAVPRPSPSADPWHWAVTGACLLAVLAAATSLNGVVEPWTWLAPVVGTLVPVLVAMAATRALRLGSMITALVGVLALIGSLTAALGAGSGQVVDLSANRTTFELSGTRSTLAEHNLDRHWRNARTHTLHDPVRWKYAIIGNHALNGVNPPLHAWS